MGKIRVSQWSEGVLDVILFFKAFLDSLRSRRSDETRHESFRLYWQVGVRRM